MVETRSRVATAGFRVPAMLRLVGVAAIAGAAATARADMTGSYTGQLRMARAARTAAVDGALSQAGHVLTGTLALRVGDASIDGAYQVRGTAVGKRFQVKGFGPGGAKLWWHGTVAADVAAGRARVQGGSMRLGGRLTFTRQTARGDGSSCDVVFNQNQTFFTTQVMDHVLGAGCAGCHVAGGQAEVTRLRVVRGDPLATARSVALLIDAANPSTSLILRKPLAAVPHGGGQQLTAGSAQVQILQQWVDLVAAAKCTPAGGGGGGGTPADVFAATCGGCHGADGAGLTGTPDIRCTVRDRLVDAVRGGRGTGMPAMGSSVLPDAQLRTIITYLDGQCSGRPRDVYAGNCAACHGATGEGGRGGPNIRCGEEFAPAVRYGTEGMPAFPTLTAAQISGIAGFLRGFGCGGGGGD